MIKRKKPNKSSFPISIDKPFKITTKTTANKIKVATSFIILKCIELPTFLFNLIA